ncbi:MAG: ATPase, T2SS/T4P/T4SS family [Desulfobacteraceae bacterium]|jgi:type IV pilus assembly protein PilB
MKRKKLGQILVEAGLVDEKALEKALEIQSVEKRKIGEILIEMGVADDVMIAKALSTQLTIPLVRLAETEIAEEIISLVPYELAQNHLVIPIKKTEKGLLVAMSNPLDLSLLDDLRFVTRMPIQTAIAPQKDLLEAKEKYYPPRDFKRGIDSQAGIHESVEIIQRKAEEEKDVQDVQELLDLTERPPIVRLTSSLLADAINQKASDIHIEPQKTAVMLRYRIDGIMHETMKIDKHVHAPVVSRIKVISNMDISIRRKPQDGKTQVRHGGKIYDLRVSTIPTSYGEKVTIRILNPDTAGIGLEELGFGEKAYRDFVNAIGAPQGLILVTGPTGSGKSTTLYASLNRLNSPSVNIVTVEDPIEYDIQGINQVQINPQAGITFAAGLRSILRQDPDIVMVGEIRDTETATIACRSAQTGHLVFSTLHTNDASSAVIRLLDLGIEAFLISASLIAVVGQRLVRKICQECKVRHTPSQQILNRLPAHLRQDQSADFWKGAGCKLCQNTGYSGRTGLYEVITITPSLRELIAPGIPPITFKKAAEKEGFRSMTLDGIDKATEGLTTIEEVFRVAAPELEEAAQGPAEEAGKSERGVGKRVPPKTSPAVGSSTREKKVLVADDNGIILKTVSKVLKSKNYITITAENGLEALRLASEEKPDLIITDLLMPKMDGITLIKKLKDQSSTREIPIMMLTAKDEVDSEVEGIDAGADDYLTKPVNAKRLLARVSRLLAR